jgi:hypothetical protein
MKKHLITSENNWFLFVSIQMDSTLKMGGSQSDDQDNLIPSNENETNGEQSPIDGLIPGNEDLIKGIVDPARTRAVDPARTRVDPARTRR